MSTLSSLCDEDKKKRFALWHSVSSQLPFSLTVNLSVYILKSPTILMWRDSRNSREHFDDLYWHLVNHPKNTEMSQSLCFPLFRISYSWLLCLQHLVVIPITPITIYYFTEPCHTLHCNIFLWAGGYILAFYLIKSCIQGGSSEKVWNL